MSEFIEAHLFRLVGLSSELMFLAFYALWKHEYDMKSSKVMEAVDFSVQKLPG